MPTRPDMEVPVITEPKPFMAKIRSTGRRKGPKTSANCREETNESRRSRTLSIPSPLIDETWTRGASSRKLPSQYSRTSSVTISSHSSSTISFLVITMIPCFTPSRRQISKCSSVCGMIPSSAAMIKATISIPATPATMFLTNFSWPGTSTIPRRCPQGRSR